MCMHHAGFPRIVVMLLWWSSSLSVVVQGFQVRTSVLKSWESVAALGDTQAVIGWAREERDVEQEAYHVYIGLGNESANIDDTIMIELPFMANQDPLGATLWLSGMASSILLVSSSSMMDQGENGLQVEGCSVLELGSGLGLPGRVSAQRGARSVVLTDNDPDVVAASKSMDTNNDNDGTIGIQSRFLEWRDGPESDGEDQQQEKYDIILGADCAYYFFLLGPFMNTMQRSLATKDSKDDDKVVGTCLIVGQGDRESQWDLYKNIKNGCYNQRTDEQDAPWPGRTDMLLYKFYTNEWTDHEEPNSALEQSDGADTSIAAILHRAGATDGDVPPRIHLSPWDHVATKEDEKAIEISF